MCTGIVEERGLGVVGKSGHYFFVYKKIVAICVKCAVNNINYLVLEQVH